MILSISSKSRFSIKTLLSLLMISFLMNASFLMKSLLTYLHKKWLTKWIVWLLKYRAIWSPDY